MMDSPFAVHDWPSEGFDRPVLKAESGVIIRHIATPDGPIRDVARAKVRQALREILGGALGCVPEAVPLSDVPGQPLRLEGAHRNIGISVSHEAGMSLVAVRLQGAVGVDLMRVAQVPDWAQVAHDYLGPQVCARIGSEPLAAQPAAFASAWTRFEACLKCHGFPLEEWSLVLEQALARCTVAHLDLPADYVGSVAIL
jgi:4'-phosphopantetheinyl transferase